MGLAGVRDPDNAQFFESKKPLCVVYFDIDYEMNPKGQSATSIVVQCMMKTVLCVMGLNIKYLFVLLLVYVCSQEPTTGETGVALDTFVTVLSGLIMHSVVIYLFVLNCQGY